MYPANPARGAAPWVAVILFTELAAAFLYDCPATGTLYAPRINRRSRREWDAIPEFYLVRLLY